MFFSASATIIIYTLLFLFFITPVIYTILTTWGISRQKEYPALVKIMIAMNLGMIANIAYYISTLNVNTYGNEPLYFISTSLLFFSPALIASFFKDSKRKVLYRYIILFVLSLSTYNIFYYPQKMEQDKYTLIGTSLKKGDIKKLQQLFNNKCPDKNIVLNYLNSMTENEFYPRESFIFLIDCIKRDPEAPYAPDNLTIYVKDALSKKDINTKLFNLLANDYYYDLTDNDKRNLVQNLLNDIMYKDDDEIKKQIANYLDSLITLHPELEKFITPNDTSVMWMIENGNAILIDYLKPYYSTTDKSILLAMSVLSKNDANLIEKINNDKTLLNTYLLTSQGGIWGTRDVELLSYIFRYGTNNLITWLLNHSLDNTAHFDYQFKIYNHDSSKEEFYCENYLLKYIYFNGELNNEQKQQVRRTLKNKSKCPPR